MHCSSPDLSEHERAGLHASPDQCLLTTGSGAELRLFIPPADCWIGSDLAVPVTFKTSEMNLATVRQQTRKPGAAVGEEIAGGFLCLYMYSQCFLA